jgi:hypothetical protein
MCNVQEFKPFLPTKCGQIVCVFGEEGYDAKVCLPGDNFLWVAEVMHYTSNSKEQFTGCSSLNCWHDIELDCSTFFFKKV